MSDIKLTWLLSLAQASPHLLLWLKNWLLCFLSIKFPWENKNSKESIFIFQYLFLIIEICWVDLRLEFLLPCLRIKHAVGLENLKLKNLKNFISRFWSNKKHKASSVRFFSTHYLSHHLSLKINGRMKRNCLE